MSSKALIAMSGGVDSSVTAVLMQQAGYECTGVTMLLYTNTQACLTEGRTCCSLDDAEDARAVARRFGMRHFVLNASDRFESDVIQKFVRVYEEGGTPNPCIDCNRKLKFSYLWQKARELGCEKLATGHYARIEQREDGRWLLKKGIDHSKDQSYVLYMLNQEQLAHICFPLGGMQKTEVREIAENRALVNAKKHDSQDICFVPDGDYSAFIRRYTQHSYPAGNFIDTDGNILGRHSGIVDYTIGQRRGLGVAAGHPIYVCKKFPETNTIMLSDNNNLFSSVLYANEINLIDRDAISETLHCSAKVRYRHTEQPCTVTQIDADTVKVEFDEPQRAITTGQAVVFYDGDCVIGGGTIASLG